LGKKIVMQSNINEIFNVGMFKQGTYLQTAIAREFDHIKDLEFIASLGDGFDLMKTKSFRRLGEEGGMAYFAFIFDKDVNTKYPIAIIQLSLFDKKAKTFQTKYTIAVEAARGKGLIAKAYALIIKKLNYTLVSDQDQSVGSARLWAQLAQTPGIYVQAVKYKNSDNKPVAYTKVDMNKNAKLKGRDFQIYFGLEAEGDDQDETHVSNEYKQIKDKWEQTDQLVSKIFNQLFNSKDEQTDAKQQQILQAKLDKAMQTSSELQNKLETMIDDKYTYVLLRASKGRKTSMVEQNEIGTNQTREKYASMTPGQSKKIIKFVDYIKKPEIADIAGKSNVKEEEQNKVAIGKKFRLPQGSAKKFGVYVRNGDNVKKVTFGDPNMEIKKDNPARRRSFRARHNCDNPGPKTKARYWSCKNW
jgi:hypothetical protein